jgi:predicted Zn-dependent peptidase
MAFKGTKTRSAIQIAEEIESVGGDLNAATSLETTAYYARVLKDDLPLAIGLLGDILQNPTFDAIELEREKDVVLQEISAIQDSPDDMIYDLAQELAFPAQALGRPIAGTAESVAGFSADDLHSFRNAHYAGDAMVLSAAGAVDHQELVKRAAQEFGALPGQGTHENDPARYCGGMRHATQKFEQSHLLMAFEGPSYRADEFYGAQVLSTIMGGGMSSRLFQEARERRGLCYAIYSFCWGVSDTGLFGVHAATGPEQVPELLDVIEAALHDAGEAEAGHDEIGRAKAQLKASLSMSLESSGARADQLARQTLAFGEPLEVADIIAKVDAVTAEGVLSMAERLFGRTPICLSSIGPAERLEKLEEVTAKFGSPPAFAAE